MRPGPRNRVVSRCRISHKIMMTRLMEPPILGLLRHVVTPFNMSCLLAAYRDRYCCFGILIINQCRLESALLGMQQDENGK